MSSRRRPLVEILYFDGCPNHEPAVELVERIDRELGTGAELKLVNVPDQEAATRLRFLGSPTIRVDGVDVDPLTAQRSDYALSCRIFSTELGPSGRPEERWVRDALAAAAGAKPSAIDRDEVVRLLREEQAQLVEVLPSDEYEDEHLPGAINIPLKVLDAGAAAQLDPARPVIVYCYDSQ